MKTPDREPQFIGGLSNWRRLLEAIVMASSMLSRHVLSNNGRIFRYRTSSTPSRDMLGKSSITTRNNQTINTKGNPTLSVRSKSSAKIRANHLPKTTSHPNGKLHAEGPECHTNPSLLMKSRGKTHRTLNFLWLVKQDVWKLNCQPPANYC